MIESALKPEGFNNWNDVPVTTAAEALATQAAIKFSAKTSLSEKVQRVFNAALFFIVGVKLATFIPTVATLSSSLSSLGFATISGSSLLQIPTVLAITALAQKIIVTLALILSIRKVLAVTLNCIVYFAVPKSLMNQQAIDKYRQYQFQQLTSENFECRRIALNKSGINYDAFVLEHETTKNNGQWIIIAGGNCWIGESAIGSCAEKYKELGFNILFVNGPGVGRSSGWPTSYSIGAGQEAGLQFLEEVIGAKKILLYGSSLGGGAQAEAIQGHDFKEGVDYMVWGDRTFDTLSNAASGMVTSLAKPLFFLLGIELDTLAGAKKLQKLCIPHIVIQNSLSVINTGALHLDNPINESGTDGVIPNAASLFVGLQKAGIQDSQRVKCYGGQFIDHNGDLPKKVMDLVEADIQAFLAK